MPDQPDTPPPPAKAIVEVFIAMNERGDAAVSLDPVDAARQLRTGHRGSLCRIVKRTYLISPPKILDDGDIEDDGDIRDVPDDPSTSAQDGETTKVESAR